MSVVSPRTAIRRHPERGVYEREAIDVASQQPHAFADHDQRLLERCPALISPLWRSAEAVD